jgi:undecaprenyl phosphate-alpha-L-ara4N flippase subunit ArnE
MKPLTVVGILLCMACQALIVVGQLFLKHAVTGREHPGLLKRGTSIRDFAIGIGCMTLWFFLWLGLLSRWDISKLFPFEGLNPALMAIAAWLVLKEKLPISAWLGLVLVCVGIAIVSGS